MCIKIRYHVSERTKQTADSGADHLEEGCKIFRKSPALVGVHRVQHQDKGEQKDAAFIQEQQLRGVSEAVGDPQKLNADEIEDTAFFVRNP